MNIYRINIWGPYQNEADALAFVLKKALLFLLITYFVLIVPETHGATPAKNKYYSIQITALPLSQKKDGFIIYKKLKEKGYLVYYYKVKIKDSWWMRLKVGIFPSIPKAQAFGEKFNQKEGFDFFVTKATVIVNAFKAEYEIITTPSAIWMREDSMNKEIFLFGKSKVETTDVLAYTRPVISLDGREIVFKHDSKVNTINVKSEKVVDKMGNGAETFPMRDSGRIAKGDLDRAISDSSKAIKINPSNAEANNNRGNVYFNKGQYDQAISDYNKAIEINPRYAEAYNNRGNAYDDKGQYDQAISD